MTRTSLQTKHKGIMSSILVMFFFSRYFLPMENLHAVVREF